MLNRASRAAAWRDPSANLYLFGYAFKVEQARAVRPGSDVRREQGASERCRHCFAFRWCQTARRSCDIPIPGNGFAFLYLPEVRDKSAVRQMAGGCGIGSEDLPAAWHRMGRLDSAIRHPKSNDFDALSAHASLLKKVGLGGKTVSDDSTDRRLIVLAPAPLWLFAFQPAHDRERGDQRDDACRERQR